MNEEKTLNDDQIVLLNNPYIDINSIKVTDESNTIVYQEFLDFIIIERGSFFEIQRILGGLIGNGETVYIDYVAEAQPSFEFAINSNRFNSSISLFNNQLEIYFRLNENNYDNIIGRDATILKSISQRILGTKINFNFFSVGAEFDDYNSNIIPYEAMRYFLTLSARCSNNFSTSVTGNLKFIELIDENQYKQLKANPTNNLDDQRRIKNDDWESLMFDKLRRFLTQNDVVFPASKNP